MAFRWLAAGKSPDFRTIAAFRRRHLGTIKELFVQVLLHCKQARLVSVGVVALDGTKVAANAALDSNRNWENLDAQEKALRAEIEKLLVKAETADKDEDDRFGDGPGDGLPEVKSAEKMLRMIHRAKAELEAQARERATEQQDKLDARVSWGGLMEPGMGGLMEPVVSLPAGSDFPSLFDGYATLSQALSASLGER